MKLKPDVDFKTPVCVAYELNSRRFGMRIYSGTERNRLGTVCLKLSWDAEHLGSAEECRLKAEIAGIPFLMWPGGNTWICEDGRVLEFAAKHNPNAVIGA